MIHAARRYLHWAWGFMNPLVPIGAALFVCGFQTLVICWVMSRASSSFRGPRSIFLSSGSPSMCSTAIADCATHHDRSILFYGPNVSWRCHISTVSAVLWPESFFYIIGFKGVSPTRGHADAHAQPPSGIRVGGAWLKRQPPRGCDTSRTVTPHLARFLRSGYTCFRFPPCQPEERRR